MNIIKKGNIVIWQPSPNRLKTGETQIDKKKGGGKFRGGKGKRRRILKKDLQREKKEWKANNKMGTGLP